MHAVENETHIFPVEFIKSSEYAYEASKRKMLLLKLPGMPSDLTQQDRLQFFSSLVPLDQTQMVHRHLCARAIMHTHSPCMVGPQLGRPHFPPS